jgi:hypothetical protein
MMESFSSCSLISVLISSADRLVQDQATLLGMTRWGSRAHHIACPKTSLDPALMLRSLNPPET